MTLVPVEIRYRTSNSGLAPPTGITIEPYPAEAYTMRIQRCPRFLKPVGLLSLLVAFPPVAQPSVLNPVVGQLSTGAFHTCAVTSAGALKCWGNNPDGQLGDGTTTTRLLPVDVSGLGGGVATVVAGTYNTCALTTGGAVKCWGRNTYGQVGDGTTTTRLTPVAVTGLSSAVAAIAVGMEHACALTTGGGVKCWGHNAFGELGDGTTTLRNTAVDVVGLTSGVTAIAAAAAHTCALTVSGSVKCWGYNFYGELGDGTNTNRLTPVEALGLSRSVAKVEAREFNSCAVTNAGSVKCWGDGRQGQLGDGTVSPRSTPALVSGLSSGVTGLSMGGRHSCVTLSAGGLKCWGYNPFGQLGDGSTTQRLTPVNVSVVTGMAGVFAGYYHSCALTPFGGVSCWGQNALGQLGDLSTTDRAAAAAVSSMSGAVMALEARGEGHTCAITTAGEVKCWGLNSFGELGDATTTSRSTPASVQGFAGRVSGIATGYDHNCGITAGSGVKCWGSNVSGQLGDGTTTNRTTAVGVIGLATGVAALSAGAQHTCALTSGGGVKCWGANTSGQLGDGGTTQRLTPVDVSGLTSGVTAISSGALHTCALTNGGGVKCWGANAARQLGDGTTTNRTTPVDVSGLTTGVAKIAAGESHTCAVTTGGGVMCWGDNSSGQLGDATTAVRATPVSVSGLTSGVATIGAPLVGAHTCAVTTGGAVLCWGANSNGQLGDGTTSQRSTPGGVQGLSAGFASVSAGDGHTCALSAAGGLSCWGKNTSGQLGDGTTASRSVPGAVQAGQTIEFTAPTSLITGVAATLTATSSQGLPVTFDTWTPGTCSVAGNTVVASGPFLCGIRASQAGGPNHAAAPPQRRLFLVGVPSLSINDVASAEGNAGTTPFAFTVTLSPSTTATVTVGYATQNGTATAGSDFTPASGTLTFAPTETSKTVTVLVTGDTSGESNEAFGVALSGSTLSSIARSIGQGTIRNDDTTPAVSRPQPSWQEFFAVDTLETPYVGDFNGDGRTDIITFTRQNPSAIGDVYVALSEGVNFGANTKWHDFFAISTDESVVIGDYNGDGKDDIATWLGKTSRQIYVALSTGIGMLAESVWVNSLGTAATDLVFAGDANGDGKDDLIAFARSQGKVYVALSDGTKFLTPAVWHAFFAVSTYERPRVADVDGDGRDDIVTFATDSPTAFGDVYVATSDGTQFVGPTGAPNDSSKWHDFFAIRPTEEIRIGDLNGDSRDDFFTFLPPPFAQCYSVLSQGTSMAGNVLWAEAVAPLLGAGDNVYVGDVNGDLKAEIIIFAQKEGKVFVSLAP